MSIHAARAYRADDEFHSSATTNYPNHPRFQQARAAVSEPRWRGDVLGTLESLLRMPAGWNSYGSKPISWDAAMFGMILLNSLMKSDTPSPSVVPTAAGGLQLEWHLNKVDLEIHVTGPYEGDFWWHDHVTGEEASGEIKSADLQALVKPLNRVGQSA